MQARRRPEAPPASTGAQAVKVTSVARDRWAYARARFHEMCSGCHTLADAGSHGLRHNLDLAGEIQPEFARFAIHYGQPGMPPWRRALTEREMEELASYVLAVAKRIPGGEPKPRGGKPGDITTRDLSRIPPAGPRPWDANK